MMKKILTLIIAISIFLIPFNSVFAATGGILNGLPFNFGDSVSNKQGTTYSITDNDTSTSFGLNLSVSGSRDSAWIDLASPVDIKSYLLSTSATGIPNVYFYDSSNVLISSITSSNLVKSGERTNYSANGVKRILLHNSSSISGQNLLISEFDVFASPVPPPAVKTDVTNIDVTGITKTGADVSWSNPTGYSGITFLGAKIYVDGTLKHNASPSGTSYSLTGLKTNTNYNVKIVASYSDDTETTGITTSFKTHEHEPITNVNYTKDHKSIGFTWDIPTDDPGYQGAKIYRDDVLISTVDKTVKTYKDESLNYSTTYSYKFISLYLDETEIAGELINVTTDPLPAKDVSEVKVTTDYNRVNLSWTLPDQDGFKHVNIYREKIEEEPGLIESIFSLSRIKVYAAETGDKIFETNGTYFNDLTVEPKSEYKYTLTTQNEQGAESEGVTVTVSTGEEPKPVLKGDGYTVDANGDYIFKWTEPTTGTVKVLLNDKLYKTVEASQMKAVIPKTDMEYNAFGDPKISLVPVATYGTEGEPVTFNASFIKSLKLPFEVTDLLQTIMGITGLVAPFILLTLVIYYFKPIKDLIVRAATRLRKGEAKHE
jgi:hypothetical protein